MSVLRNVLRRMSLSSSQNDNGNLGRGRTTSPRSKSLRLEPLEERRLLTAYAYTLIADTSSGSFSVLGYATSVNDYGEVAFAGVDSTSAGVYTSDGTSVNTIARTGMLASGGETLFFEGSSDSVNFRPDINNNGDVSF